jgi:hypothetical protein
MGFGYYYRLGVARLGVRNALSTGQCTDTPWGVPRFQVSQPCTHNGALLNESMIYL